MAEQGILMDPLMDNQTEHVKMLGEGLLEVRALCHDSTLAIGDFVVALSVLLKVDRDHGILRKLSRGSDELNKKPQWVEGEISPAVG
jgi:hypothetical protein